MPHQDMKPGVFAEKIQNVQPGVLDVIFVAGAVFGLGIIGFMLYMHYKNKGKTDKKPISPARARRWRKKKRKHYIT